MTPPGARAGANRPAAFVESLLMLVSLELSIMWTLKALLLQLLRVLLLAELMTLSWRPVGQM